MEETAQEGGGGGGMEECLRLLRGSSDEQRLVGLLLATKFISGNDPQAVLRIYEAIGFQFINRLLKTGMGKFNQENQTQENYLHLAVTILSAFCRIPELACSEEIIDKVPVYVEVLNTNQSGAVLVDCTECLLAIASASEKGFSSVCNSQVFLAISQVLQTSSLDGQEVVSSLNLLLFLATKITMEHSSNIVYAQQLAIVVPSLAKNLFYQQSALKFEVLEILRIVMVSPHTMLVLSKQHERGIWSEEIRSGLGQILHSHVAAEHRSRALQVTEEMVELMGASWLIGTIKFPDNSITTPSDRFLFLVVESLRVEIPVVLGELLQINSDPKRDKYHSLAAYYALLEHIINFISEEEVSSQLDANSSQKIVSAVDEITGVILERVEDAKDNGIDQGDELLSSVRLLGRYLAEAPTAHNTRLLKLLGFVLSIRTEGEQSSFYAVQFMIPALLQLTMKEEGCEAVVSSGGHKQIISFIISTLKAGQESLIIEAVDILLNLLQKKDRLINVLSYLDFVRALPSLANWAARTNRNMEIALVASFCMVVLGMSDEVTLRNCLEPKDFDTISNLIGKCLQSFSQVGAAEEEDLMDVIISESLACLNRYPSLSSTLKSYLTGLPRNRASDPNIRMLLDMLC